MTHCCSSVQVTVVQRGPVRTRPFPAVVPASLPAQHTATRWIAAVSGAGLLAFVITVILRDQPSRKTRLAEFGEKWLQQRWSMGLMSIHSSSCQEKPEPQPSVCKMLMGKSGHGGSATGSLTPAAPNRFSREGPRVASLAPMTPDLPGMTVDGTLE